MAAAIAIKITAVDAATKRIDAITKRIDGMGAPARRMSQSLAKLGDATGLNKLSRGIGDVARSSADAARNLTRIVEPIGVIAGAASIAGMYRLVGSWATFATELGFSAQRMGITSDRLMSLQGSARLAGSSAGALTSGLENMGQVMYDAVGGRNAEAVVLMNTLGVSFRGVGMHARSVTDVLPEVADKIAALKDPYAQAQAATVLFGGAAKDLLPWLRQGSKGMAEYEVLARRYGVVNDKAAAAALDFTRAQTRLEMAGEGLRNSIAERLSPVITPLLRQMADWIALNRDMIAQRIGDVVGRIAAWLEGVNWTAVGNGIKEVWGDVNSVAQAFGGWKSAAEDLAIFLAGSWLARVTLPILRVLRLLALIPGSGVSSALLAPLLTGGDTPHGDAAGDRAERAQKLQTDIETMQYRLKQGGLTGQERLDTRQQIQEKQQELGVVQNGIVMGGHALSGPQQVAVANEIRDRMRAKGYSENEIAGAIANAQGESSLNPANVGDKGAAAGLFMWRDGRRRAFANRYGHDVTQGTVGEQIDFMDSELHGPESAAWARIHGSRSAAEAGSNFSTFYERPKDVNLNAIVRERLADEWASKLGPPAQMPTLAVAAGAPAELDQQKSPTDALKDALTDLRGRADVNIRLSGAPPGTKTVATASGDLFSGPPRVEHAMSGF